MRLNLVVVIIWLLSSTNPPEDARWLSREVFPFDKSPLDKAFLGGIASSNIKDLTESPFFNIGAPSFLVYLFSPVISFNSRISDPSPLMKNGFDFCNSFDKGRWTNVYWSSVSFGKRMILVDLSTSMIVGEGGAQILRSEIWINTERSEVFVIT